MTFSTFVTPTRDSDTWIAGDDAWTSGNRETGLRSMDSAGYRADGDRPPGRETNPRERTRVSAGASFRPGEQTSLT